MNAKEDVRMTIRKLSRLALASRCALVISAAAVFTTLAGAQEIAGGAATTTAAPMSKALVPISQAMLDAAASDPKNWIHSNGSYEQTRFYPGKDINAGNVARLKPAFV